MDSAELRRIVLALPETEATPGYGHHVAFKVAGRTFAYLHGATDVVNVKATREEQAALVAENSAAYAPWYSSGRFGWVAVTLAHVEPDDLAEVVTEAWRLTAPKRLVARHDSTAGPH